MRPAPGASSPYMPFAANWPTSRNGEPGSIRRMTRSRGRSLPRASWRLRLSAGPPIAAAETRSRRSSTRARLTFALAAKAFDFASTAVGSFLIGPRQSAARSRRLFQHQAQFGNHRLAHGELLHLAGDGGREAVHELDVPGNLEVGDLALAEGADGLWRQGLAGLQHD